MAKNTHVKKLHTSMRGEQVNMEEMRLKNENTVAVTGQGSQVQMNARGDVLKNGIVFKRRENIDQEYNAMLQGKAKTIGFNSVEADEFVNPAAAWDQGKQERAQRMEAQRPVEELKADVQSEEKPVVRTRKLVEKED